MKRPVVQVLIDDTHLTPKLHRALCRIGADVEIGALTGKVQSGGRRSVDARVLLTSDARALLTTKADRLRAWSVGQPSATLVLSDAPANGGIELDESDEGYAFAVASNPSEDELAGQLAVLCGMSTLLRQYHRRAARSETQAEALRGKLQRLDDERRLAAKLQRELLPGAPPDLAEADLSILYRPADLVGGDLYDVFRLDDEHIALFLIDATGHGIAAALVAGFAARALRSPAEARERYEPDVALRRLNDELLDAELGECHFVAVTYAVYHEPTGAVRWARGGACYPIVVPRGGSPRLFRSEGPLVGIRRGASFEVCELRLDPGDGLILHTDGLDHLPAPNALQSDGDTLAHVEWLAVAQRQSLARSLAALEGVLDALAVGAESRDDVTVIALQNTQGRLAAAPFAERATDHAPCSLAVG